VVAIEQLDQDGLWDLSQRIDELGVLSVYVHADPRHDPNLQAAGIDMRNRFRELQRRVADDPGSGQSRDTAAALERLWPQIESLISPRASGRGRIAFAALGSDWSLQLDSAMPVANRLVLDRDPFIHPLLELLDEGRTAGVVLVSAEQARLLEWRVGSLQSLRRMEQPYVEAPHERSGQIGGGPEGQFNTPMREQRQARERDRMQRFLHQVSTAAAELASDRSWERILISGEKRWIEPTTARFPQPLRDRVFADPRILNGLNDVALAAAVTEWAHEQHNERERQLLGQLRDAAGSGVAALGLSEVAAALNAGRVAQLVYDPRVRYVGTVGADGALYGGEEVGPDAHPRTPEPRLTERLVEQALKTKARISPVEGAADGALKDAAGIAALLRW
jgi:Bacterial archaeo-eukaryotic release factor family 10